jgi:hypothetical protein
MGNTNLEHVRKTIGRKYLGQAGIFGVGAGRKTGEIRLYVEAPLALELLEIMPEIESAATPFKVIMIESPAATMRPA